MPWIIASHSPFIVISNWCGEKICKNLQNWKYKMWLVNRYNIFNKIIGKNPFKNLVMVKRWVVPKICAIQNGM
jgi:hypothetical protein